MKTIVNKPWGSYQILDEGNNYLVKNILVKPHSKLSLQSHKHRSEHWVVVQGTAEVTVNDKISILEPNKNIFIPSEAKHPLPNNYNNDLIVIEVWYGKILDEEDIESTVTDRDPATRDFYDNYDKYQVTRRDEKEYRDFVDDLSDKERDLVNENDHFYSVKFSDNDGIIMPIILEFEYEDGEKEVIRIPVEIWRFNRGEVTKVFKTEKPIKNMTLDPFFEIADVERNNNHWPEKVQPTRFETFKTSGWGGGKNLMQRVRDDAPSPDTPE